MVIPLFLDGPAFAVYDQLSDEDKADATKIEAALRTASFQRTTSFEIENGKAERQLTYFWPKLYDLLVWLTLAARRMKKS